MTHTRNQKRQLDDPGDISISLAPQPPKKGRNKPTTKGATNATTSVPNAILPTSLTNPTSTEVSIDTAGTTVAPKKKSQKKKAAEGTTSGITGAASVEGTQTSSKRKKNPSMIAQQVALQEATDNDKKIAKKKKQVKKAASKPIDELPKETHAFLERARASSTSKPPNSAMLFPSRSSASTTNSSGVEDSTPNHGGQAPLSKRTALNQLIRAHQQDATTATASVVSAASSLSSITPSESVSQGIATPTSLEPLASRPRPKPKKAKASTQSLLTISNPLPPSRDASPFLEQLVDGDLAEYHSDLGIHPAKLLDGIPAHLAPLLTMPEPLPGPLYIPERQVPLPDIDLSVFPAAERAKIKVKRQLKVKDLKPADHAVVSSAISRFGALLVAVCGFPDSETAWLLACNANHWASKKHGRHLKLTKESEYLKLLYDRIPQIRAGFIGIKVTTNVALAYKLEIASSPTKIQGNVDKIKHLLKDANFTLTSLDGSGGMYEHGIFKDILKNSLFQSAEAAGVVHNDLFGTISIPCMALTATAVEKVLRNYKSGTQGGNRFNAKEFMPIYFSHLATLAAIYNLVEAQNQLVDHLQETSDELRKPYLNIIRSQTIRPIRPIIPQALIAARYRTVAAPNAKPDVPKLRAKHLPPDLAQELVCKIKMKLGAPRSVSVSSAPDSEVVDAIYGASQADRNTAPESFNGLLAQIAGSSDSEVQAMRAGALKSNAAGNTMVADPQDSDSSNGEPSQATGTLGPSADKEATLSGDESEDSDDETDGEGAAGLVPTTQHPGDVTMKTDDGTGNSEDEEDEEDEEDDDDEEEEDEDEDNNGDGSEDGGEGEEGEEGEGAEHQ
ncbi:hypothetical protein RSOLAG22IIIB_10679 [Rhizoctonia solani]|uniref:DUF6532 domain-containing protein n=1 Tax=Rhizoctonia solani TaxID=456999 RepID=A0A0K6G4G6_9AGAM|nr:hypothetical protein RSOLAG22IIIB_10679 [Rhizoctonia solani]